MVGYGVGGMIDCIWVDCNSRFNTTHNSILCLRIAN
jgi:hypothetical protein